MSDLEQRIFYEFKNPDLLKQAMTHKSYAYEFKPILKYNEVFEFLGDAVLDLILAEYLMEIYPDDSEGILTKKRASLVNEEILAEVGACLGLQEVVMLGKGEAKSGGMSKPRLLSSAFEALVGALFKDGGYEVAKRVVRDRFKELVAGKADTEFERDYKTRLQELVQAEMRVAPTYELISDEGPSHNKIFKVNLLINSKVYGQGEGRSKKAAEQEAAKVALQFLIAQREKK